MLKLPGIFSSDALFQADSVLTVHGTADAARPVSVLIRSGDGCVFSSVKGESGDDGRFSLTVPTPPASFDEYTVAVTAGDEECSTERVLFGELWLMSGQSNMELPNLFIPEAGLLYDSVAEKNIRVFAVSYDVPENRFPWEPDEYTRGNWVLPGNRAALDGVSAMGLKFVEQIYTALNREKGKDVPVGFLNASWGGTPITAWFPRDAILADPCMTEIVKRTGNMPEEEKWNT